MISVVIPTYNEEKTIEESIRQFEALKLPHEVIVSDSHSADRTAEIARQCADELTELPQNEHGGVSKGRNRGAAIARGEFIVFLDSGDEIPDINAFFKKALRFFEKDPRLVGLTVRIEVDPRFRTLSDWMVFELMNAWFVLLNNVFHFGIAAGKFQMVRADAFHAVGGFTERMPAGEDIEFFRRLGAVGRTHDTWQLSVRHSGRRFHQLGAWRTLYRWIKNALWVWMFNRSADEGWQVVR